MIFRRILEWARAHHFLAASAAILIAAMALLAKACTDRWSS